MVRKSYGKMRGTRKKMAAGEKPALRRFLNVFDAGDIVHVDYLSSSPLPHPKFQGRTGKVLSRIGNSYLVQVRDGNAMKKIVLRPEHLKK